MQNLSQKIRIAGIVPESVVDGKGIRFTIFVQGCHFCCKGCHNPNAQDFNGGYDISLQEILGQISQNPLLDGITLSGGEPFAHAESLAILSKAVKAKNLNIWCYTGYTLEELNEKAKTDFNIKALLNEIDVLVDGLFVEELKDLTLPFRGSKNQRIIELSKGK